MLLTSGEALYASELRSSAALLRFGDGDGDLEPAGAEETTGRSLRVHQELLDRLPQGIWQIRYEMRAETPGAFHALPGMGEAMYVPEIRANGAEERLSVAR